MTIEDKIVIIGLPIVILVVLVIALKSWINSWYAGVFAAFNSNPNPPDKIYKKYANSNNQGMIDNLVNAAIDSNWSDEKGKTIDALIEAKNPKSIIALISLLENLHDKGSYFRLARVVMLLGKLKAEEAVPQLIKVLRNPPKYSEHHTHVDIMRAFRFMPEAATISLLNEIKMKRDGNSNRYQRSDDFSFLIALVKLSSKAHEVLTQALSTESDETFKNRILSATANTSSAITEQFTEYPKHRV